MKKPRGKTKTGNPGKKRAPSPQARARQDHFLTRQFKALKSDVGGLAWLIGVVGLLALAVYLSPVATWRLFFG